MDNSYNINGFKLTNLVLANMVRKRIIGNIVTQRGTQNRFNHLR